MQFRSIFAILIAATHTVPALAGKKGDCFIGLYEKGGRNPNHIVGKETNDDSGILSLEIEENRTIRVAFAKCKLQAIRGHCPSGTEIRVYPSIGYDPNRKILPPKSVARPAPKPAARPAQNARRPA
ncbi:hypothetical protein PspLS_00176 [Pyricularia sp. CBS 133598]|nr:hypothetical protein PspLS_00176 [Pyricularia sp. CBS 133598]